jgi:hypothetical protein
MKNTTWFVLKYFLIWIVLSVCYFFLSEKITKLIAPGFDSVELWLLVVAIGSGFIFILTLLVFSIGLIKRKRRFNRTGSQ